MILHRRVIDETDFCNERNYTSGCSRGRQPPPGERLRRLQPHRRLLRRSAAGGVAGTRRYVPDRSISRLVQTAAEMRTVIATFIDNDGNLKPQTAVLSAVSAV